MFQSSTANTLPIHKPELTEQSKSSNYNWKTWAKASLVFATTTGAFLALKTTGSFSLVSSWLKNTKTDFDDQETKLAVPEDPEGIEAYSGHSDFKESSLAVVKDSHQHTAFMPQKAKRSPMGVPEKIGPEFQVNTYTTGMQEGLSITRLADSKFVVAWMSDDQDGDDEGIYGQMFNADGTKFLSEFQVNTYITSRQMDPSIAGLSDSNFVVVWMSEGQDGSEWGIYGQMFNADGSKFLTEFQVNTYTTSVQWFPSIAGLSDGKFVVTWTSGSFSILYQDGDSWGIYGQMYNADGSKYLSEFQVNTYTTSAQWIPSIAGLSDGKFVVAWASEGQDGDGMGIYGQMFNTDGSKFLSEFQVNTCTVSTQAGSYIAKLSDGKFVVTWNSDGQDRDDYGIYGQMFNTDGSKFLSEFQVNTYAKSTQWHSSVTGLDNGKFVVVWESDGQDRDDYGIYGQMFNADGSKFLSEFQVNTYTMGRQVDPSIVGLSDNKFVVTWTSGGFLPPYQDGDYSGIYGQMFGSETKWIDPNPTGIIIGAVIGGIGVVLCIVGGTVGYFLYRRRNSDKADSYMQSAVNKESASTGFIALMKRYWAHRTDNCPEMKEVVETLEMKEKISSFDITPGS